MQEVVVHLCENSVTNRKTGVTHRYWQAQWGGPSGQPMRKSLGNMTKKSRREAESECRRIAREINSGILARGQCPTLEQWVEHHRKTRKVKPSTAAQQDASIDTYLSPRLGHRRMDSVTTVDAKEWVAWLRTQPTIKSEWTVSAHLRIASALWNSCVESFGGQNPFGSIRLRVSRKTPAVPNLTEADVVKIADEGNRDWRVAIALCGLAGLRRGEVAVLTWDRILWDQNRILVPQSKTEGSTGREDRSCLMVEPLARILLEARETAGREPLVTRAHLCNSSRDAKAVIIRAGFVPWPKPLQSLRRWRASTWRQQYPADVVNRWLGHSQQVAMDHYVDVPENYYKIEAEQTSAHESALAEMKREIERLKAQLGARDGAETSPANGN
ncbi:MAG: hypothetical protein IPK85_03415 [Gemmatimonadetes bacterium]|nr:hypothetical protein [Gemmatimonadota bacterium]